MVLTLFSLPRAPTNEVQSSCVRRLRCRCPPMTTVADLLSGPNGMTSVCEMSVKSEKSAKHTFVFLIYPLL